MHALQFALLEIKIWQSIMNGLERFKEDQEHRLRVCLNKGGK